MNKKEVRIVRTRIRTDTGKVAKGGFHKQFVTPKQIIEAS
jgi:hypothetical protein